MSYRECEHPNCKGTETPAAHETDMGWLCQGHFDCAQEIARGEQRLISVEAVLSERTANADFLRKMVGACHMMISRNDLSELQREEWESTTLPSRLHKFIVERRGKKSNPKVADNERMREQAERDERCNKTIQHIEQIMRESSAARLANEEKRRELRERVISLGLGCWPNDK